MRSYSPVASPGAGDRELFARDARPLTDRTGLIATAVCDHPEITRILAGLAELEYHIALSSIKIDAIEDPILEVLARQGEKALAIAEALKKLDYIRIAREHDARGDEERDSTAGAQEASACDWPPRNRRRMSGSA